MLLLFLVMFVVPYDHTARRAVRRGVVIGVLDGIFVAMHRDFEQTHYVVVLSSVGIAARGVQ